MTLSKSALEIALESDLRTYRDLQMNLLASPEGPVIHQLYERLRIQARRIDELERQLKMAEFNSLSLSYGTVKLKDYCNNTQIIEPGQQEIRLPWFFNLAAMHEKDRNKYCRNFIVKAHVRTQPGHFQGSFHIDEHCFSQVKTDGVLLMFDQLFRDAVRHIKDKAINEDEPR